MVCMDEENHSTALIVRELQTENGVVEIGQRSDGFVNVTRLCQAKGKEYSNWWLNKSSKEYVEALSLDLGIPRTELRGSYGPYTTPCKYHITVLRKVGENHSITPHPTLSYHGILRKVGDTPTNPMLMPLHSPHLANTISQC